MFVVDLPFASRIRATLPPFFLTMSAPAISFSAQSAPFTSTSGLNVAMSFMGVGSLKSTTWSTAEGLYLCPFRSRDYGTTLAFDLPTDESLFRPTTRCRRMPSPFKYRTCPACMMSTAICEDDFPRPLKAAESRLSFQRQALFHQAANSGLATWRLLCPSFLGPNIHKRPVVSIVNEQHAAPKTAGF